LASGFLQVCSELDFRFGRFNDLQIAKSDLQVGRNPIWALETARLDRFSTHDEPPDAKHCWHFSFRHQAADRGSIQAVRSNLQGDIIVYQTWLRHQGYPLGPAWRRGAFDFDFFVAVRH
jgi:hypothetical protein